jgi:hypothetical protein
MLPRNYFLSALLPSAILLHPLAALASNNYQVTSTQGNVQAQYPGSSNFQSVNAGMRFPSGTLLRTGSNSAARIRCPNESRWTMQSNQTLGIGAQCLSSEIIRIGRQNDNLLGGTNLDIPFVTSPRRTSVLGFQLTLRWNPVPASTNYIVKVTGPEGEIWESQVTGNVVEYAGAPLSPGRSYRVIVEAINGLSSQLDQGADESDFELLQSDAVERVQQEVAAIEAQDLPPEMQALQLADVYIREDLLSEAIDILESIARSGSNNLEVYQVLGDLYRYVGLNLLAAERYEQALTIATQQQSIEGEARAKAGLAEIKVLLGNLDEALTLLTEAQQAYVTLEDTERAAELQERLEELSV